MIMPNALAVDLVVVAEPMVVIKPILPRQYNYVLYSPNDQTETLGLSCFSPTISAALAEIIFIFLLLSHRYLNESRK